MFILCTSIGMSISFNSCVSDQKDKDLISIQTFLERHDGSQWTAIEEDMRIYLKFNQEWDKALELWSSDLELAQLMVHKECFYYSSEPLNPEEVTFLEDTNSKMAFTNLEKETYTFSREGERIKLEFRTENKVRTPIYFSKSTEDLTDLNLCPDQNKQSSFNWMFLKR